MAVKRVLLYILAPLGMLALLILGWLLFRFLNLPRRLRRRPVEKQPVRDVLKVMCVVVLFFFYPALVRAALSLFACYKLDNKAATLFPQFAAASAPHGYWVHSMQQPCWEGWHLHWGLGLGLPCLLFFCFAMPMGMWWFLYRSRNKISIPGYKNPLMFLYHNYKPSRWYWEVVSTVQIALLVAMAVFSFTLGAYFTTVLLNVSIVIFWAMQLFFLPFASKELHHVSLLSFGCLYATTTIALTLFTGFSSNAPPVYREIVGVVGLVVNAGFILWCCFHIAVHSSGIVAQWLGKLRVCLGRRIGAGRQEPQCDVA